MHRLKVCEALGSALASSATPEIKDWHTRGTHTVSSAVEAASLLKIIRDLGDDIKTLLTSHS